MLNNRKVFTFLLITLFLAGFFLRFYKLSSYPVGFHIDEASKGYSAYSLLRTGKDDNNHKLPLYIDIFGDNSPAGYHYLTIVPVAVFGLTEFAVRSPGALFGSLSILVIFFLSYSIFEDKKISLLSSFLLALAPWHINLSRASSEGIIALFFIMAGFALVFWSTKKQRIKYLISGTFLLSISFFFYQTPRVFVPLLFLIFIFYVFKILKIKLSINYKKTLFVSFIVMMLLDISLIFIVSGGTGRFSQVSIFSSPETRLVMEEQIREDGVSHVSAFVTRIYHNKATNFFLTYTSNYLEYFSLNFLFIKDLPQWYFVPNMGVLYLFELPFILFGACILAFSKSKMYKIPLLWLFSAPLIAAITVDTHNVQRALVMFPAFEIIAAYGLVYFFTHVVKEKRKIIFFVIIALYLFNVSYFLHQYFIHAKVHRTWYRNNGFSQMMTLVNKDYKNYDRIIATRSGGGYPLFLFYSKYDPVTYQNELSPKDKDYKGFGKFYFVPDTCPLTALNPLIERIGSAIYIEDGACKESKILKNLPFMYVLREDGTKAFRVVYVKDDKVFKTNQ